MHTRFAQKVVLITGASSGIGESLARQMAAKGANLVLAARREDRLKAVAAACEKRGVRVLTVAGDVTRDADLTHVVARAREVFGKIDIVIANAGFGVAGNLETLTVEDYRRQFETNVFGVLRTVYATLEDLKKSHGQLVLLGSVAGHVALPGASPYSMSKFAVRALAEALTEELRPQGIAVTLISPGFVDSEIRKVDNEGKLHQNAEESIPAWIRVPTDRAVAEMIRAIAKKKRERFVTGHAKIILALNRFCPWAIRMVKRRGLSGRPEPK